MSETVSLNQTSRPPEPGKWVVAGFGLLAAILLVLLFWHYSVTWFENVSRDDSYYSHAILVPFVSGFFVWRARKDLAQIPRRTSNWGYAILLFACSMILGGDLLGIQMLGVAAAIPLMAGLVLIFVGPLHLQRLWFPLAFLLFMVPLPLSVLTTITFHVKMFATDGAVYLARTCMMPMIRDGSYVRLGDDSLLVGDVCGGLRSLISLLALGAIMSYISGTKPMARVLLLVVSAPIAVLSNILRIFLLCVIAYFWGSELATGWVHDLSGVLIYVVALVMMYGLDRFLYHVAPAHAPSTENSLR